VGVLDGGGGGSWWWGGLPPSPDVAGLIRPGALAGNDDGVRVRGGVCGCGGGVVVIVVVFVAPRRCGKPAPVRWPQSPPDSADGGGEWCTFEWVLVSGVRSS
jgi:hypothetical protein